MNYDEIAMNNGVIFQRVVDILNNQMIFGPFPVFQGRFWHISQPIFGANNGHFLPAFSPFLCQTHFGQILGKKCPLKIPGIDLKMPSGT